VSNQAIKRFLRVYSNNHGGVSRAPIIHDNFNNKKNPCSYTMTDITVTDGCIRADIQSLIELSVLLAKQSLQPIVNPANSLNNSNNINNSSINATKADLAKQLFLQPFEWPEVDITKNFNPSRGHYSSHFIIKAVHALRLYQQRRYSGPNNPENSTDLAENSSAEAKLAGKELEVAPDNNPNNLKATWARILLPFLSANTKNYNSLRDCTVSTAAGGYINFNLARDIANQLNSSEDLVDAKSMEISPNNSNNNGNNSNNGSNSSNNSNLFQFQSIGVIDSIFREKYATPRQGSVFSLARGRIILHSSVSLHSLDGLAEYSHIWLIFVFHESNSISQSKIRPPRLNGRKLGIYATRSPHRINPIGLSLVKLEKIEGNSIFVSGLDLITGTPVLDIKPFHPADSPPQPYSVAQWMRQLPEATLTVKFTEKAVESLRNVMNGSSGGGKLDYYEEFQDIFSAITQCLQLDPRTQHSKDSHSQGIYGIQLDKLEICYQIIDNRENSAKNDRKSTNNEGNASNNDSNSSNNESVARETSTEDRAVALVFKIEYVAPNSIRPKLRTAPWYEQIKAELAEQQQDGHDSLLSS
jgi:tRNA-Thr(GGU) m(6)t(6)A37 methyltransferase TsaA